MMIRLKQLRVHTVIGTYEWERAEKRELRINVLFTPVHQAAADSDNLNDAVDYAALSDQIGEMASTSRFLLIEKFAAEVLRIVLSHPLVRWAEVEVAKPTPLHNLEEVSVILSGEKGSA